MKQFPLEFQKALVNHEMDYTRLTKAMLRNGYPITKQFLGMMGSGLRNCTPETLKRICTSLQCDEVERKRLNLAAAKDLGYDL
jgi:hypothetical protein